MPKSTHYAATANVLDAVALVFKITAATTPATMYPTN
jgi:hypothetical protein